MSNIKNQTNDPRPIVSGKSDPYMTRSTYPCQFCQSLNSFHLRPFYSYLSIFNSTKNKFKPLIITQVFEILFTSKSKVVVINNSQFKCKIQAQSKSSMAPCSQVNLQNSWGRSGDLNMPARNVWLSTTSSTTDTLTLTKWLPMIGTCPSIQSY
jgi:hypothetical protein